MNLTDIQKLFLAHVSCEIKGVRQSLKFVPLGDVHIGIGWDSCWSWDSPYPYTDLEGNLRNPRRVAWELFRNELEPLLMPWEGSSKLWSTCGTTFCCNPQHLDWTVVSTDGKRKDVAAVNYVLARGILRARILDKCSVDKEDHWIWTGARNAAGYAVIQKGWEDNRQITTTVWRLVWELWNQDSAATINSYESLGRIIQLTSKCNKGTLCVAPKHIALKNATGIVNTIRAKRESRRKYLEDMGW